MTWTLISQDPERANAQTATEVKVRVGTTHRMWEMTAFLVLTGGMLAGGAWYVMCESAESDLMALLPRQVNALIIQAVLLTNLGAIACFGLAALFTQDPTMLGLYAVLLWNHWALSLISGSFVLWSMLQGDPEVGPPDMLNECAIRGLDALTRAACEWNFKQVQSISIGTTAALWIIEFYGCCIASRFVSLASAADAQPYDGPEDAFNWQPQYAGSLPPTPRTAQIPDDSHTEQTSLLVPPTPRSGRPPMTPRTPRSASHFVVDMSYASDDEMEEIKTPLPPVSPRPMRFGWW
ncbi:hypothetical protein PENSPDRAFT_734939 [Peniophora sp. CONT]|nr:hypothetical protein PENSPDRAFT_734939 [Peniophora sp. CONT]